MNDASEFERESHRIDQQIWDALGLRSGEDVLFLGLTNEGAWVARALEIGAQVTVLATTGAHVARAEALGATVVRGSAAMLPLAEGAYDAAIAMHFLHEIDPGFHTQVVSELARVARRVAIVEPAPPVDALGKRIANLYARAKRESGQFESYQPIEYWRKLLSSVKAEIWQNLFTFNRLPPQRAVAETVSLILDAMAIEAMPETYLEELRDLAARPDAQLLPLSRIVLVGTASGVGLAQSGATLFRPALSTAPALSATTRPTERIADAPIWPSLAPGAMPAPTPPAHAPAAVPPPPPAAAAAPPPATEPGPSPPPAPFGAPFALPEAPGEEAPFGAEEAETKSSFGWAWEPPDLQDTTPEP